MEEYKYQLLSRGWKDDGSSLSLLPSDLSNLIMGILFKIRVYHGTLKLEAIKKGFGKTYRVDYLIDQLTRFINSSRKILVLQSLTSKQRACLYHICEDKNIKVEKPQRYLYECEVPHWDHSQRCPCKGTRWLTQNQTA